MLNWLLNRWWYWTVARWMGDPDELVIKLQLYADELEAKYADLYDWDPSED